jgi:acylphosphatase
MSIFRLRRYGSTDWLQIAITQQSDDDEVDDLEQEITEAVSRAVEIDSLHVQRLNEYGQWEDDE